MPWGQAQPVTPTILLTDAPALQGPFLAPLFSIALAIINQRIGFTHLYFVYCPSPALSPWVSFTKAGGLMALFTLTPQCWHTVGAHECWLSE